MRPIRQHTSDLELWNALCGSEASFYDSRMDFVQHVTDLAGTLRRGLGIPHQRGTALRLLLTVDESVRRELFTVLLALAIDNHSDLGLSREVIASFDRRWLNNELRRQLQSVLESAGPEEYRGTAELLRQLKSRLLPQVVARAAEQDDPEIREIATEFSNGAARHLRQRFEPEMADALRLPLTTNEPLLRAVQAQLNSEELQVLQLLLEGHSFDAIAATAQRSRTAIERVVRRIVAVLLATATH